MIRTQSTLKNYDRYLLKIKSLAKVLSIKIVWQTTPSDGMWQPHKRRIIIDPDLTESETISTLLHEFGHIIDDYSLDEKTHKKLYKAYSSIYTDFFSEESVIMVALTEGRAWNYGAAIAKNLGIKLGKWYHRETIKGVRGYRNLMRKATT